MALFKGSINTEGTEIALSAATAKTILQILAPTNQRLWIAEWSVSFDASALADAVEVELVFQTTAGTMSAATERKDDPSLSETLQVVGQFNATSEPTLDYVFRHYNIQPASGGIEQRYGRGELVVPGADRLGIRCTAPATVNVAGHISWWE
ncbi:MAG: hypothetical protein ACW987_15305 [Candidatus Thorarchaeota archaeon]|jgi:hypothetical protein